MSSKESIFQTWKIIFHIYLSIEGTALRWGGMEMCCFSSLGCPEQKWWTFWTQFPLAPPLLDSCPAQPPAFLLLHGCFSAKASPLHLPARLKCCFMRLYLLPLDHLLQDRLCPTDAAAAFILPSPSLCPRHMSGHIICTEHKGARLSLYG